MVKRVKSVEKVKRVKRMTKVKRLKRVTSGTAMLSATEL